MQKASLFDINKSDSVENIAVEDDKDEPITDDGFIWND